MLAIVGPSIAAEMASVEMKNRDGQSVGTVTMRRTPQGALVHAKLMNLPAGTHAFHVHAIGTCEPPFKSAGGHFNPSGKKHGILSEVGLHAGDMPNIHVPDSGALEFEVLATGVSLDDQLFDADGSAIVIHEGADDYQSDPAGAAGPRIACGVILQ
jgi:Cu-Zn family superoxide dismutase